ncbi:NADH-quinone oxidoreductase subunit N [bacterium]|nr:NADH-quinone oxidoreductase subunit N [bacterium]
MTSMEFSPQTIDFTAIMPIIIISAGILVTLLLPFAAKGRAKIINPLVALIVLLAAFISSARIWDLGRASFDGMYTADNATLFASFIFIIVAFITVIAITARYCPFLRSPDGEGLFASPEVFPLMLTVVVGAIVMSASRNLILTFLAIETLSIPLYVLAGMNLSSERSKEASLKYFLTGAFASGFLAYGISLIYGAVGKLGYHAILDACSPTAADYTLYAGLALVAVGFGFKVALVPFHAWVPDVYQGSPALISGFMASLVKAAGFTAILRFFGEGIVPLYGIWWVAIAIIAALTMTVGNLMALNQIVLKRLLAYSSIAHAGYLLLAVLIIGKEWSEKGVTAGAPLGDAMQCAFFYLAGYVFAIIGSFAIIWWLTPSDKEGALLEIDDVRGLNDRHPLHAALFALFLFSLAGFPITAGFLGKFFLFASALSHGFILLVVFALLNAVLSAYYYLKIIVAMYMKSAPEHASLCEEPSPNPWIYAVVWTCTLATLWLGIIPASILGLLGSVSVGG